MALTLRALTAAEVVFSIKVQQDMASIRGNVMASGDAAVDAEAEKWVKDQLAAGNEWAWAEVTVVASWRNFEGRDYLGCCSYESEEDFKKCDYYKGMCEEALADLNKNIAAHFADVKDLLQSSP